MNILVIQFSLVITETQGVEKHYRMQSESVAGGGEGVGGEEGVCVRECVCVCVRARARLYMCMCVPTH